MLKSSENQGNKEGDNDALFDKNPNSDDVFFETEEFESSGYWQGYSCNVEHKLN